MFIYIIIWIKLDWDEEYDFLNEGNDEFKEILFDIQELELNFKNETDFINENATDILAPQNSDSTELAHFEEDNHLQKVINSTSPIKKQFFRITDLGDESNDRIFSEVFIYCWVHFFVKYFFRQLFFCRKFKNNFYFTKLSVKWLIEDLRGMSTLKPYYVPTPITHYFSLFYSLIQYFETLGQKESES